ncbi:MAG: hypothetical protein RXN82_05980 [Caldivirga sp.]
MIIETNLALQGGEEVRSINGSVIDLAIGADAALVYVGPEDGFRSFTIWETLTPKVKDPRGILVLKQSA